MGQHVDYFHLSPVILTDALFFKYNPDLIVTGTFDQREDAYLTAEQYMMQHLQTFLVPTTVTGTYLYPHPAQGIRLDHGYIQSIDRIKAKSLDDDCDCDLTENDACAIIRGTWGYIDFRVTERAVRAQCGSCGYGSYYNIDVTYTAGLPTGTSALDRSLHKALSKVARVELMETVDPGANEGGPGDPGVKSWSSLGYSETRQDMMSTSFGQTAIGNYAARLVKHLKKRRPLKL